MYFKNKEYKIGEINFLKVTYVAKERVESVFDSLSRKHLSPWWIHGKASYHWIFIVA